MQQSTLFDHLVCTSEQRPFISDLQLPADAAMTYALFALGAPKRISELGILDRYRQPEIVIFPFTVLASNVEKAFHVNPVGALH